MNEQGALEVLALKYAELLAENHRLRQANELLSKALNEASRDLSRVVGQFNDMAIYR